MCDELAGPSIQRALREARARRGLTQRRVAGRAGVSQTAVTGWELGRRYFSVDRLPAVLAAYELTLDEFCEFAFGKERED